jgi:NADH-quinone oxidoreductase subunit L
VIIGMHHEQDMRKMGGLAKFMPWTAVTCWIGTLALIGTPFFSGYYSKDLIIDAVKHQHHLQPDNAIATYAYVCVMIGVFVTAFYSFRLLFTTFHGKPRFDTAAAHDGHGHDAHAHAEKHDEHHAHGHPAHDHHAHDDHGHRHHGGPPKESPWVVIGPLVALAIPSVIIGAWTFEPLLFGGGFGESIFYRPENAEALREIGESVGDWLHFALWDRRPRTGRSSGARSRRASRTRRRDHDPRPRRPAAGARRPPALRCSPRRCGCCSTRRSGRHP